jgi:Zn-dependent peptidase ImmA (M78 family)
VNYKDLAGQAFEKSLDFKSSANIDLASPINIFDICEHQKITVRFLDISMEGMYMQAARPQILLSSLRPLVRRVFNCAHELGHHLFNDGTTVDALLEDFQSATVRKSPKEFRADAFAGFCLMPVLGVRKAFAIRKLKINTALPVELYTIACDFGVGYETLLTHLTFGLKELAETRFNILSRETPQKIRKQILGFETSDPLIIADEFSAQTPIDAEVGTRILFPNDVQVEGDLLNLELLLFGGRLYRCQRPGIARALASNRQWATFIRIAKFQFVGLSRFRHLEEIDE